MTKTFKHKHFTKRDYECTNLVMCIAEHAPDANWVDWGNTEIPHGIQKLYEQTVKGSRVAYYGYL